MYRGTQNREEKKEAIIAAAIYWMLTVLKGKNGEIKSKCHWRILEEKIVTTLNKETNPTIKKGNLMDVVRNTTK